MRDYFIMRDETIYVIVNACDVVCLTNEIIFKFKLGMLILQNMTASCM